jgi:hypothetical protein
MSEAMYDISLKSEAQVDQPRFDWKLPVLLVVINLIAIGIQWGTISSKMDELFRDKEQQERHLEFIDSELKVRGAEAGEAKGFHDETIRRFDSLDRQLTDLVRRPR